MITGGEGMEHNYDNLYVRRLEKIVKPFGGTVEKVKLSGLDATVRLRSEVAADIEALDNRLAHGSISEAEHERIMGLLRAEPTAPDNAFAWVVKLTPEMKAKILKAGLPIMLGVAAAAPSVQKDR